MRPIGQLRHLLALEARSQVPDMTTGLVENFALVGTAWACIEPLRATRQMDGMQVVEAATHWILMRYVDPGTFTHLSDQLDFPLVVPGLIVPPLALSRAHAAGVVATARPDPQFVPSAPRVRRWRKVETKDPDGRRIWLQVHAEEETTGAA